LCNSCTAAVYCSMYQHTHTGCTWSCVGLWEVQHLLQAIIQISHTSRRACCRRTGNRGHAAGNLQTVICSLRGVSRCCTWDAVWGLSRICFAPARQGSWLRCTWLLCCLLEKPDMVWLRRDAELLSGQERQRTNLDCGWIPS
jgi:hypothetical protein